MSGFWRWLPGKSIGPFAFGDWAEPYIVDYDLRRRMPDCSIADWETYEFPGFESWIVVEKGRIIEVHCWDEIEYNDIELIGMPSSDIRLILGNEDKRDESIDLGYILYYFDLGLTLFVEEEVVSSAVCGHILPDKDVEGTGAG